MVTLFTKICGIPAAFPPRAFVVMTTSLLFSAIGVNAQTEQTKAAPSFAASSEYPLGKHNFILGVGRGVAFEKDIFNIRSSGDADEAEPDPAFNFAYVHNLTADWTIGLHVYGYQQEFYNYITVDGVTEQVKFKLNTSNRGLKLQRYLMHGRVHPYVYGVMNIADGSISVLGGKLEYDGYSFGGGGGALLRLGKYLGLTLDGIVSLGAAEWDTQPFSNSADSKFTPSYFAVTLNAVLIIP